MDFAGKSRFDFEIDRSIVFAAKSYFDLENFSMMRLLRLSNVLTKNIFDDEASAAQSNFD